MYYIVSGLVSICNCYWPVIVGLLSVIVAVKANAACQRKRRRQKWNSLGKDVIVLHGLNRGGFTCMNISPFAAKMETYLKMSGLKYEFDSEEVVGYKSKSPWITINGEEIVDTDIIIDYLAKKFDLNFSKNLNTEQKSVARAMTIMICEHMNWGLMEWRLVRDPNLRLFDLVDIPLAQRIFIRYCGFIHMKIKLQGLGLHSPTEIETMIIKDIEAISLYLGDKPFLMGDEPCEVDCSLFGIIAQFAWGIPDSTYAALLKTDYVNLLRYCFRMQERFYPEWKNDQN